MRIELTTVHVDDQEKALRFYTDVLGSVKKAGSRVAMVDDTCGNRIQITQLMPW